MNNRKKYLVLSIVGVIGIVFLTIGVTLAFFNYVKEGSTENVISAGTISFIYDENKGVGNGVALVDALPVDDVTGKGQTGADKVFEFRVVSTTGSTIKIPYEITVRKIQGINDLDDYVKLYLTKVENGVERQVAFDVYGNLANPSTVLAANNGDKHLYNDEIPVNANGYTDTYRLRMYIADTLDMSPSKDPQTGEYLEDANGNYIYPYNNQTYKVIVNVYATGQTAQAPATILASQVSYLNSNSTLCTSNQTVECALDELNTLLSD